MILLRIGTVNAVRELMDLLDLEQLENNSFVADQATVNVVFGGLAAGRFVGGVTTVPKTAWCTLHAISAADFNAPIVTTWTGFVMARVLPPGG